MKIKFICMMSLLALLFVSCELGDDDNYNSLRLEAVAVKEVEIPEPFIFGEINEIIVRYNNPSDCHNFYAFDVRPNLNVREITVYNNVYESDDCMEQDLPTEQVLRFRPISNGTVVFKFFSGLDSDGNREFLEYTVEVQE